MPVSMVAGRQSIANIRDGEVQSRGRYSSRPPWIARKVTKVAVGLFVLHVITNVPQADAGFALLALCMSVCTGATYGFGVMACAAACAASAAAPTP